MPEPAYPSGKVGADRPPRPTPACSVSEPRRQQLLDLLAPFGFDPDSTSVTPMSVRSRKAQLFRVTHGPASENGSLQDLCLKAYFATPPDAQELEREGLREYTSMSAVYDRIDGVPRPVGYIAEIDGVLMEFVKGLNLRRHLARMLLLPLLPRSRRSSEAILSHTGRWARRLQDAVADRAGQTTLGVVIDPEWEFLRPGAVRLETRMIEQLRGLFVGHADLLLDTARAHGDYHATHQFLREKSDPGTMYLVDWGGSRPRHRLYDLHTMTVNILSWASFPSVSVSKALEFGAAVERGYFGGEPVRDSAYWLTRAARLVHAVARPTQAIRRLRYARKASVAKWLKIAHSELGRCIASAQKV